LAELGFGQPFLFAFDAPTLANAAANAIKTTATEKTTLDRFI
jgi:hypothetical protein